MYTASIQPAAAKTHDNTLMPDDQMLTIAPTKRVTCVHLTVPDPKLPTMIAYRLKHLSKPPLAQMILAMLMRLAPVGGGGGVLALVELAGVVVPVSAGLGAVCSL